LRNQSGQIQPKSEPNLGGFNLFHDPNLVQDKIFCIIVQTLNR